MGQYIHEFQAVNAKYLNSPAILEWSTRRKFEKKINGKDTSVSALNQLIAWVFWQRHFLKCFTWNYYNFRITTTQKKFK